MIFWPSTANLPVKVLLIDTPIGYSTTKLNFDYLMAGLYTFLHFPMRFFTKNNFWVYRCAYFCEHPWHPLEVFWKLNFLDFQPSICQHTDIIPFLHGGHKRMLMYFQRSRPPFGSTESAICNATEKVKFTVEFDIQLIIPLLYYSLLKEDLPA